MRIKHEDFDLLLREVIARPTTYRLGQAFFHYAAGIFPEGFMSDILGTDADPYYQDDNIPAFIHWLWTGELPGE